MKELSNEEQENVVYEFVLNRTEKVDKINYLLTSEGWAKTISKWAGVKISTDAVNRVFITDYKIDHVGICTGINCFAERLKLSKIDKNR